MHEFLSGFAASGEQWTYIPFGLVSLYNMYFLFFERKTEIYLSLSILEKGYIYRDDHLYKCGDSV